MRDERTYVFGNIKSLMDLATTFINTSNLKTVDESAYYYIKDRIREVANYISDRSKP